MCGIVFGRQNLQNAQAILAISDEGERAGGYHPHFHVIDIVELTVGGEKLIEFWGSGNFHVNNGDALLASGDVSVGAGDVDVSGIGEWNESVGDNFGLSEIGDIEDFHAVAIHYECVAELNRYGSGVVQDRR